LLSLPLSDVISASLKGAERPPERGTSLRQLLQKLLYINSRDTSWGIVSMRWLLALFCLSFVTVSQASAVETLDGKVIEKILILKSSHQLQLINDGKPLKTYRISLGKRPKGAKLMEGDKRTPEGFYWVDWRKVSDRFNLAMHISYPNISDSARARREGVEPGGMIMIHGTPDSEDTPEDLFHTLDWTDGCIAMRNMDMREVWNLVPDGTMIEIRP
jgi:murein L,D-transpeptidase YafK